MPAVIRKEEHLDARCQKRGNCQKGNDQIRCHSRARDRRIPRPVRCRAHPHHRHAGPVRFRAGPVRLRARSPCCGTGALHGGRCENGCGARQDGGGGWSGGAAGQGTGHRRRTGEEGSRFPGRQACRRRCFPREAGPCRRFDISRRRRFEAGPCRRFEAGSCRCCEVGRCRRFEVGWCCQAGRFCEAGCCREARRRCEAGRCCASGRCEIRCVEAGCCEVRARGGGCDCPARTQVECVQGRLRPDYGEPGCCCETGDCEGGFRAFGGYRQDSGR